MKRIMTNLINIEIKPAIDDLFDFSRLIYSGKDKYPRTTVLDTSLLKGKIVSVCYEEPGKLLVMMKKGSTRYLTEVCRSNSSLKVQHFLAPASVHKTRLLTLFINALAYDEETSNLCPHFWRMTENNPKGIITAFHAAAKQINGQDVLSYSLKSFIREDLYDYFVKEGAIENDEITIVPEFYSFVSGYAEPQKKKMGSSQDSKMLYVGYGRSFLPIKDYGRKADGAFIDLMNQDALWKSIVGQIEITEKEIHEKFSECITFSFRQFDGCMSYQITDTEKENAKSIVNALNGRKICVKDISKEPKQEYVDETVKRIQNTLEILKEESGCNVVIEVGENMKDDLEVQVVENANHFFFSSKDNPDPYVASEKQHISYQTIREKYKEKNDSIMKIVLRDLIVKDDIIKNRLSFFDISLIPEGIAFFERYRSENEKEDTFIGMFFENESFHLKCYDDFDLMADFPKIQKILTGGGPYPQSEIEGVVSLGNNINIIHNTGWTTLPDVKNLFSVLPHITAVNNEGKERIERTNAVKNTLLSDCLDINYLINNNILYYAVGEKSKCLNPRIADASRIREVVPMEESKPLFDIVLQGIQACFIRYNRPTVIPYPFKYMREYYLLKSDCKR